MESFERYSRRLSGGGMYKTFLQRKSIAGSPHGVSVFLSFFIKTVATYCMQPGTGKRLVMYGAAHRCCPPPVGRAKEEFIVMREVPGKTPAVTDAYHDLFPYLLETVA